MKRIAMTVGTILGALALAVSSALPANAAVQAVGASDPAGDQWHGSYWGSASTNAQQASDLRNATISNDGNTVTITWTLSSVLPTTNTSYIQQVGLTGYLSAQPLSFNVYYNGNDAAITYASTSPQCSGLYSWSRNTTNNTITISTPLWCLPNGINLSSISASAQVYRDASSMVGDDNVVFAESLPWK